jgi:hypothetical protein
MEMSEFTLALALPIGRLISSADRSILHKPPNAAPAQNGHRLKNRSASDHPSTWKLPRRTRTPSSCGSIRTVSGGLPGLGRRR